jgi:hypothetical protein
MGHQPIEFRPFPPGQPVVLVGSLECGYESERPDRDQALGLREPLRPEAPLRGLSSSASSEGLASDIGSESSSSRSSSPPTARAEDGGAEGGAELEYAPLRADLPF